MRLKPGRLRTRLTLWYVLVLGTMLMLSWAATCALLFWQTRTQLGRFSIEEVETVEGLLFFKPDGQLMLRDDYHNHPESKGVIERFVEVRSQSGSVLFRNDRLGNRVLGGPPFAREGVGGYSERSTHLSDGTRVRAVSRVHILDGRRLLIRLAHSEEPLYSQLADLIVVYLGVLPLALLVAWIAGYALARRALTPIAEMARSALEITPDNLQARLPAADLDDELGELARVFNQTLTRLEQAFEQLRQFTADVSHELRTPLAVMRSIGEVSLHQNGSPNDSRDAIGSMLEEVNRLSSLIENLLYISRAEAGALHLQRTRINVMSLVRDAAGLLDVLMEDKSVSCVFSGDETLQVEGDYIFLRQALINLIHNATRYSPIQGVISIRVRADVAPNIIIEVGDHGPGIPFEHQSRVFDRFYRVDRDRARHSGGAGLGLAITKWVVEAHSGTVSLTSKYREGCLFQIRIPQLADQSSATQPQP